jgi:hypothetical protein
MNEISGFNLTTWRTTEGVADTVPLDSGAVDNLLSDLNVAGFQLFPACSHTDNTYTTAAANWGKRKKIPTMFSGCVTVRDF